MLERLNFYIRHSLNDMRVNRQRTLFALLCIAAGVAAIVSMQTLAHIITDTLDASVQETNRGDLRFRPSSRWDQYIVESNETGEHQLVFTAAGLDYLQNWLDENYPGSEITYQQTLVSENDLPAGFILSIPDRDTYKLPVFNYVIEADRYPLYGRVKALDGTTLRDLLQEPTDIVLSENLADDLEAEIGDLVRVSGASEDFVLRGIVPTDAEAGLNEQAFVGHLFGYYYLDVSAASLFDTDVPQATMVYIKLGDPSKVDEAAAALNDLRLSAFSITTTTDILDANEAVSSSVDDLVVTMSLISLLIGGIGIVNTMMVIVSRRTKEVAVLKTIGLEPNEVVQLFLVEAVLMGIIGSLLGIVAGWGLTYAVKSVGENFLGQRLSFSIAPIPAVNGFVVGVAITTIFGFLPTLAAGQIRPANVLRPSENVMPSTGRLNAFVALVGLIMALSLVAQGLIGNLLDFEVQGEPVTTYTAILGGFFGALIAVPVIAGGILDMRRRRRGRSWALKSLLWLVLLVALPAAGAVFGYFVPALIILTATFIIAGYLYITLWMLIWAVSGGSGQVGLLDPSKYIWFFPLAWITFPFLGGWLILRHRRPGWAAWALIAAPLFWPVIPVLILWLIIRDNWPGILILLFPLFWPLIVLLPPLLIPAWIIGRLIQSFAFIDFKIAMRSMLSTKARGASTLLALVVGVFTLSTITMLVDSITSVLEELVEQGAGGNLMIFNTGGATDDIALALDEQIALGNADSYGIMNNYETRPTEYYDASAGKTVATSAYRWKFDVVDGRTITSNLPDLTMIEGRNLDPALDSEPDAEGYWSAVVYRFESEDDSDDLIGVGDKVTLTVNGDSANPVKVVVVGVAEGEMVFSDAEVFVPLAAFAEHDTDQSFIIAEVPESKIKPVRRAVLDVPGTIVIETRIFNDLVNSVVDQFTSLPMLVAALALVTGGIVIANSVALSTLERRREIGIMKAVGVQRERVLGMLLLENGLMGIVGGLIGVGISFVAIVIMLRFMLDDQFGSAIPYMTAFIFMALCIVISLLAAMLSVWGASGEKPLNVLRYE
ncbi:MAG: FtsX-like permease family protein [Anaerolineae bacterium]|nr:FtsX-like permease family protein [Anaerolineae bacterium]